MPFTFGVDSGTDVVDAWNRLNPKLSGGGTRQSCVEPLDEEDNEKEASDDASPTAVSEPLADRRILV